MVEVENSSGVGGKTLFEPTKILPLHQMYDVIYNLK